MSPHQLAPDALFGAEGRPYDERVMHRLHLGDWSSIHDLTGRHIAAITPDPARVAVVDRGVAVPGVALFGALGTRLVDTAPWRPRPAVYAPRLPKSIEEHATAVTTTATELQEYFGIAEDAPPCAVIMCTEPLFTALRSRIGKLSSRERRSLLRRLRRAVAALGSGHTPVEEPDDDLAGLAARASHSRAAHDALSSKHLLEGGLDMIGAVRSAASKLSLQESQTALLPWREVRWPVTAFVPPSHTAPSVRMDRG